MEENFFSDLGNLGEPTHIKKNKKITIINNIFGNTEYSKPVTYINTDDFYIELYNYYYKGGYNTILATYITEIFSLLFGITFITFIFVLLDWDKILQCGSNNETKDCGELFIYLNPKVPNIFCILILLFASIFTIAKISLFIYNYKNINYIYRFYTNNLNITSKQLQTMSWASVINEISKNENINLSIYDITSRILRKDNYYTALIHKDIININTQYYTKQLELNLKYIILSDINNIDSSKIKRKFILYGIANLFLSIFIFIYIFLHFFASNIEDFYTNKNFSSRKYCLFYKWKFRDYNELEHFFEKRINKSIKFSYEYLKQFPSPILQVICKFICLISGAFIGFFLILSILDESILLYVRLFDRSLIFYTGIIGAISATSRSFLKSPENTVYNPEAYMNKVFKYTHYMPSHWNKKVNTYDVRDEFINIFPYTLLIFFSDLLSVITTPIILIFILPKSSSDISNFIKTYSVDTNKIGKICIYSKFDLKIDDNKIKKSTSSFLENHSIDSENQFEMFSSLNTIIEEVELTESVFI